MKIRKREVLFVLVLAAALALWALWPKETGSQVRVTIDGAEQGGYLLSRPGRTELTGYGGYGLTLVIEDGAAHVEDSTCPDLICQKHKAISRQGEQIICLPARIVITVTDGEEAGFDAIAQ